MTSAAESPTTETRFTHSVLDMATKMGLLTHFCADARRCAGRRGFPDLLVAGKCGVLFVELKTDSGDTSLDQDLWLWTLDQATGRSYVASVAVWRPEDLDSGQIERQLADLRSKPAATVLKNGRRNYLDKDRMTGARRND